MIKIDGSFGSGSGQILRTACALAAITKKSCHIFNIRTKRPRPGLMPQHLLGLQALAQICKGRLEGDEPGSQEIKFYPGEIYKDQVVINIPTAGSITLISQLLIPPALFAPSITKISFIGGATDTFFSPTIDYFRHVFLKIIEIMEAKVEINVLRRGYYPEGKAKIETEVFPSKLKNLNLLERGALKKITAISGASTFLRNKKVAERQLAGVREILGKFKLPIEEKIEYFDVCCPGSQICLIAEFENTAIGTDNLGKLNKRAEDIGKEAALELLKEQKSGACLDKYLGDQILPYLALSSGKSQVTCSEITKHSRTNIWVIEKFLDGKFEIKDNLISWNPKKF
jgi:RNA 3'-terminal phosphate cyclase (GTP)